jgi:hypothetical protein
MKKAVPIVRNFKTMKMDKTGSNLTPFMNLFADGKGDNFKIALSRSFSFASYVVNLAKNTMPAHKLDLWDQAVQYELAKIGQSEKLFVDGTKLFLEKYDNKEVWQHGLSITNPPRPGERLWVLPDAIIKTPDQVISIELDHGAQLGRWAQQLLKAVRILASDRVDGVLYCFYWEKGLSPSESLLGKNFDFSEEFHSLINALLFNKKLGLITLGLDNTGFSFERTDAVDFFEETYVTNPKMSLKSRQVAQNILESL